MDTADQPPRGAISPKSTLSAGSVSERLERLEARGVIRGYRVEIDPAAFGYGMQVIIGIELAQSRPMNETVADLLAVPEVTQVDMVSGRWDLSVRLVLRDQERLRDVLLDRIWSIPDFRRSESMIVLEPYNSTRDPV